MLQPASLDVVYPGLWLDDGVYATHGHYLDRHVTVPSFERLGSGVLGRLLRAPAEAAASPDDYEVALAPMYELLDAVAARVGDGRAAAPGQASAAAWQRLSPDQGRAPTAGPACWPAPSRSASRRSTSSASGRSRPTSPASTAPREPAGDGRGRGAPGDRRAARDLRPHPPIRPAARRRRQRVAAGRRRAARQHGLLGVRVDAPSIATGATRTGPDSAVELESGGEPRFRRLLDGVDAGALQAAGSTTPGVKQVA